MAPTKSSDVTVATCSKRITALKQYASKGQMSVHGQPVTEANAEAIYQACIDTRTTLVNLRGQVDAALAARNAADAAMSAFDAGLESWVDVTYGPKSQAAVDFGYAKKAPVKPTVVEKAAAVAKAQATRKAHGIQGKRQRAKATAEAPATPTPPAPPTGK
jgi:hypothetical protein